MDDVDAVFLHNIHQRLDVSAHGKRVFARHGQGVMLDARPLELMYQPSAFAGYHRRAARCFKKKSHIHAAALHPAGLEGRNDLQHSRMGRRGGRGRSNGHA